MYVLRMARQPDAPGIITAHELNTEMAALLAQHNGGLDWENVGADEVADADVADDALQFINQDTEIGATNLQLNIATHHGALVSILDTASDPFIVEFSTEEQGMLRVTLGGAYLVPGGEFHLYIQVDGVTIAMLDSAWDNTTREGCFELDGVFPLPAGDHTIELKCGARTLTSGGLLIIFNDRGLIWDVVYR